jgi:hypothetical protein
MQTDTLSSKLSCKYLSMKSRGNDECKYSIRMSNPSMINNLGEKYGEYLKKYEEKFNATTMDRTILT